jgi:hypothetical protein
MFQSIKYKRYIDYNAATNLSKYEFELIDSDFGKVVVVDHEVGVSASCPGPVIQEYSKRNLNVAVNLVRCFRFCEKRYGWTIAEQIEWAEKWQPRFTSEIKTSLDKYLTLV